MAPAHRHARPRRHGTAGFLLTETLATFTISAFVLLGLVASASVLTRAVDRSVAHVQDVDDLERTLGAIRRDLSGMTRARWNGFEPQPFVFRGGPNSLFFPRKLARPDGTAETRVVALREIVVDGHPTLVRSDAKLYAQALSFDDLRFGPQTTLATGPVRLRYFYLPTADDVPAGTEPQRRLSWPTGIRLPAAILVEAVDATTGHLILSSRVAIHADADIGCLVDSASVPAAALPPVAAPASNAGQTPAAAPLVNTASPAVPPAGAPSDDSKSFCGRTVTAAATPPVATVPAAPVTQLPPREP